MKNKFKSGFVSVIGRPNVGKSTLVNKLIGKKVSIVTNKAQTTRNNIRGILTKKDEYQIVFTDTPGVHTVKKELDRFMNSSALRSTKDVDVLLFLAPANEKLGKNDMFLLNKISNNSDTYKILVITKSDTVSKVELLEKINEWKEHIDTIFDDVIIISSIENGVNLEKLLEIIVKNLPENNFSFFDDDIYTDQSNRFLIKEIIRENILFKTGEDIPHSTAVLIDKLDFDDDSVNIMATIVCERKSQKGIIIGHKGKKISDIKYMSRKKIKEYFEDYKNINLELYVKVHEKWRNSGSLIKRMGYDKDKY